ncbi:MAG: thioredoxin [Lachnoclostridium edouardi]|uniref:thioredoxin n=1 Tax=Lachnoclostridium edouardi TaxID=1926283 RepID=UPI0026DAFEE6|nr:thioredoxin [Lachnoclostridium edouardi]MDO4279529.1 thioredoxin [Lachnoclostridium edouardi]
MKNQEDSFMSIITITKENFNQEVLQSEKPILVDFWASWCGPCRMLSPVVDRVADNQSEVKVGKINVDEQPDLAQQFRVMTIPTLILFKNGQPVKQSVGVQTEAAIMNMIKN